MDELRDVEAEQKAIIQQISERARAGRPVLAALDDMLDELELRRQEIAARLEASRLAPQDDFSRKLARLHEQTTPEAVELILNTWLYYIRDHADFDVKQPIIDVIRMLIQKVVIGKTPGHQPASLEIHGRIATIMAAMEVSTLLEKQLITLQRHHYLDAEEAGLLDTEAKKKELLDAFAEELDRKRLEWKNLQVSVVAGA